MRTATQLAPVINASNRDIENWVGRLDLSTPYEQPERGLPRMYSKANAFELGMIAALVRGGALPSHATTVAARFAQDGQRNWRHSAFRDWLVFRANDCSSGVHTDKIDSSSKMIKDLDSITFSVVYVRKLIDGIDELYKGD